MSATKLALLPILLGGSIALATPVRGAAQEGPQGAMTIQVVAHNQTSGKVRVYVHQGGQLLPLGLVDGMANATLSVPNSLVRVGREIELEADPLESNDWFKSDPVRIGADTHVLTFTIAAELDHSSVSRAG